MGVKQKGGAFGVGMALGMAIPAVLGAAGKILPGIFGKKAKTTRTTNNNYNNRPQLRARPQPPPQYCFKHIYYEKRFARLPQEQDAHLGGLR
jgi:hypothetical protein